MKLINYNSRKVFFSLFVLLFFTAITYADNMPPADDLPLDDGPPTDDPPLAPIDDYLLVLFVAGIFFVGRKMKYDVNKRMLSK